MLKYYSQVDPRWKNEPIGESNLSIGDWGCKLASWCNAILILLNKKITPKEGAKLFKFTKTGKFYHSNSFGILEYEKRGWGSIPHRVATDYVNSKGKAVLTELRYNPRHWVLVHKWSVWWIPWFLVVDPYTYMHTSQSSKIVKKLKWSISGYALLKTNKNDNI